MNNRDLEHAKVMRIERLLREGFSMRKVAHIVGASYNTILRYKRLLEEG